MFPSVPCQSKYKEGGRRRLSQSFYSQLPETSETQLARSVSELQSEVRTHEQTHTLACRAENDTQCCAYIFPTLALTSGRTRFMSASPEHLILQVGNHSIRRQSI